MEKEELQKVFNKAINGPMYFSRADLMYRKSVGLSMSGFDYKAFCDLKTDAGNNDCKVVLPLKSFNSKSLFYYYCSELNDLFIGYLKKIDFNNELKFDPLSLMCSELDGTLQIEGINSTRRKIISIIKDEEKTTDKNYQIVKNMYEGLLFIMNKPDFNKENLKKLYEILSNGCLREEDALGEKYYRDDSVEIGNYKGCPFEKIEESMDSLFSFVESVLMSEKNATNAAMKYLPFVCHYYILYIHPYFDYNGRTARMVYLWINYLSGIQKLEPYYLSEAINDNKSLYYKAIEESRDSQNDLTYFLIFNMSLSAAYEQVYNNCKHIKDTLEAEQGIELTQNDIYNIKRILINRQGHYFTPKTFDSWTRREVSRQATHKDLSRLEHLGILESKMDGNKKAYRIKIDWIEFETPKVKEY